MIDRLHVLTPDKVVVTFNLAAFGSRAGAFILDAIFLGMFFYAASTVTAILALVIPDLVLLLQVLLFTFGFYLYFGLQEALWRGQTLGKKILNLRVMSADGTPVTPSGAILRNLLRFPPLFIVDLVCMFLNKQSQRIGDLVSHTVVVHEPRARSNFSPAPHQYGEHVFENSIGELKGMTLEDYHAIKRLCDRFPELPPVTQARSIAEIWEPFAEEHKIEPIPNVHPIYQMEAVVMKYGRQRKLV
ncbi:MAG: RDD family protein [Fimbriimonadaceae bacterium]|nr:RDD family protein [Fimbriimonadaceae bacterium]